MELVVGLAALLLAVGTIWYIHKARQKRETLRFLEEHFPNVMGKVPTLKGSGSEFTEEELRLLATGAYYESQMSREEVLEIIKRYGADEVRRYHREFPNLPISYIRFKG